MIRKAGPAGDPGPTGNDVFGDDGYERLDSMGEGSVTQRSARQPSFPGPYDEWPMSVPRLIRETAPYRGESGGLSSNEFYGNPAPRFKGSAFRDRETGEIFESGTYHNPENLPDHAIIGFDSDGYKLGKPSLESGFIDDAGNFYTREEALNMRTGEMEDDPETVESASSNWDIPGGGDYDAIGAEKAQSYQGLAASRDGERLIAALLRNAWDAEGSPIPCPNISDQFPGLSHDIVMPLGVQNVPVDKISGSATGSQWPSVDDKEGQKYLTHWFNTGTFNDLDPVKVLKVQDTYWVEGDHYRPALLKELDPYGSLKATVTEVFTAKGDGFDSTGTPATDNWYTSFAAKKTAIKPSFKLRDFDPDETPDALPPAKAEMWYERSWQSWAVRLVDTTGQQVGDTVYVYSKAEALAQKQEWEAAIASGQSLASRRKAGVDVWMPIPGKEPWEISESEFESLYPSIQRYSEDMTPDEASRYALAIIDPETCALYTEWDWTPGRTFHSRVKEDNGLSYKTHDLFRGFWDGSTFYFQSPTGAWRGFQYSNPLEHAASRRTATEQPAARMTDWYPRLSDQVVNLGIQQIPVASVQGSAIKDAWPSEDENRGDRLSKLLEEQGNFDSLKPMKMLKVDDTYWAVDGHHRVSLMQKYNPGGTLQALVTERFPQDDSAQPSYMDTYNYTPSGGFDTGGYSMDAAPMQYWASKKTAGVDVWTPIPGKEPWNIRRNEFVSLYPSKRSCSDTIKDRYSLELAVIDPATLTLCKEPLSEWENHADLAIKNGISASKAVFGFWDGSSFLFQDPEEAWATWQGLRPTYEASRRRQANEASDFSVGNASDMPTGMMAFMDDGDGETGWADATVHPNAENREGLEKSLWTEKTASANRNDVLDFDAKVRMGGRRIRLGASEEEIWTRISEIAPELTDEQVAKYQNMLAMSIDPDKVLHAIETDGIWGL